MQFVSITGILSGFTLVRGGSLYCALHQLGPMHGCNEGFLFVARTVIYENYVAVFTKNNNRGVCTCVRINSWHFGENKLTVLRFRLSTGRVNSVQMEC